MGKGRCNVNTNLCCCQAKGLCSEMDEFRTERLEHTIPLLVQLVITAFLRLRLLFMESVPHESWNGVYDRLMKFKASSFKCVYGAPDHPGELTSSTPFFFQNYNYVLFAGCQRERCDIGNLKQAGAGTRPDCYCACKKVPTFTPFGLHNPTWCDAVYSISTIKSTTKYFFLDIETTVYWQTSCLSSRLAVLMVRV
jgi:hypothetical protein